MLLLKISFSDKSPASGLSGDLCIESSESDFFIDIRLCKSSPAGRKYFSGKVDSSESVLSAADFGSFDEIAKYLFGKALKLLLRPVSYTHLTLPTILLV